MVAQIFQYMLSFLISVLEIFNCTVVHSCEGDKLSQEDGDMLSNVTVLYYVGEKYDKRMLCMICKNCVTNESQRYVFVKRSGQSKAKEIMF